MIWASFRTRYAYPSVAHDVTSTIVEDSWHSNNLFDFVLLFRILPDDTVFPMIIDCEITVGLSLIFLIICRIILQRGYKQ